MAIEPSEFPEGFMRVLSRFLFEDIFFYAILPIATIAMVYIELGTSMTRLLMLKEWSFATIVIIGSSLLKFVRLKVEHQQSRDPLKREVGSQFLILLLVMSVLVLALVVLKEERPAVALNEALTARCQMILFAASASFLLALILAEEGFSAGANRLPWNRSPQTLARA